MITFFGTALLLFVSLVYGQTGQKVAPPTDGTLQCQCTCTSAGLPNKNIYTSGNMNIVEKTPVTDKPPTDPNAKDNVATSKQTLPKVEATRIPIDKEVTQFKDVAVSMIRHSLGSGGGKRLIKTPEKKAIETSPPKIKWLHSASSNNAREEQNPTETLNIATKPLALHQEGSTFTTTTRTLSEDVLDDLVTSQPPIVPSSSSANVFQSTGHTGTGTDTTDRQSSLDNVSMGIPNANTDNESNNINAASGVFNDFSNSAISNRNSDSVAADIGFVLDGSAPNPILSGVMSGLGGGSLGSGFIVENINSKRSGGYFVDKNLNNNPNPPQMLSGLSNPPMSAVQQSHNSVSGTTTTKATRAPATTVNRSPIKDNTNSVTGTQNNNNIPTNNGNNGKGTNNNNNKGMMNNNNKVNNNNNRRWNTNSMDKPKSQMNNRNNNNNNNNKNRPVNNNNNNNWQNNNKQNNNRNVWQKNQMKPFDILQDQKQNTGWNNNGQWGNWGTTTVSTMSYAMMGMDPLLFLGQHQL